MIIIHSKKENIRDDGQDRMHVCYPQVTSGYIKKGSKCITEQGEREKKDIRFHHHHYIVSPI